MRPLPKGEEEKEVMGRIWDEFVRGNPNTRWAWKLLKINEAGESRSFRNDAIFQNGTRRPIRLNWMQCIA